jgi:hypothetical protein
MERTTAKQNLLFGSILRICLVGYWATYIPLENSLILTCVVLSLLIDTHLSYTSYGGKRLGYYNLVALIVVLLDICTAIPFIKLSMEMTLYVEGVDSDINSNTKNDQMVVGSFATFIFSISFDIVLNLVRYELR